MVSSIPTGSTLSIHVDFDTDRSYVSSTPYDWCCGFGQHLMSTYDDIFKQPDYISTIVKLGLSGSGDASVWTWYEDDRGRKFYDGISNEFFSEWKKFHSLSKPILFEMNSSAAINMLSSVIRNGMINSIETDQNTQIYHDIRLYAEDKKCTIYEAYNKMKKNKSILLKDCTETLVDCVLRPCNLLFLYNCYAAGKGICASYGRFTSSRINNCAPGPPDYKHLVQPDVFADDADDESKEQKDNEDEAIRYIDKICNIDGSIRGIVLEPIRSSFDFKRLTHQFCGKLVVLAKKYSLVLVCDEVGTAVRTGKPFGYMHYPELVHEISYLVFGKCLTLCGVAIVLDGPMATRIKLHCPRNLPTSMEVWSFSSTRFAPAFELVRSTKILKAINEKSLMDYSVQIGRTLAQQIKRIDPSISYNGIGAMMVPPTHVWNCVPVFGSSYHRWFLPLNIKSEDIIELFNMVISKNKSSLFPPRFNWSRCKECLLPDGSQLACCDKCPNAYHQREGCLPTIYRSTFRKAKKSELWFGPCCSDS